MGKLRYGLIGCGRISPNHIAAVQANQDNIELVAVCDIVPERMDLVLTQAGVDSDKVKSIQTIMSCWILRDLIWWL